MDHLTRPAGDVSLLYADIENSAALWEAAPGRMPDAMARHDGILRDIISRHRGAAVKMSREGMHAAFADAVDAIDAAIEIGRAFADPHASLELILRVRCGVHCGPAGPGDRDSFGSTVNLATRLAAAAHGGQLLVSAALAETVASRLPAGVSLVSLGAVRLRGLSRLETAFQICHADLAAHFPPLRAHALPPNNLPQARTLFVGREDIVPEVTGLLATNRLLTLLGPGGIGKTRLSLQAATALADSYADGVWFVEFAALTDPTLIAQVIAQTMGLRETSGRSTQASLLDYLGARRMLLIMDNCEHLIDACARLADAIMRSAADVAIIATSREPLQIDGETLYEVPALALPPDGQAVSLQELGAIEAVALFVDRARHALHGFGLDEGNTREVSRIVTRLDGIPLAIELAAARVRTMSPREIEQGLDDRFRLLTGGSRAALPRQQTLRALIEWSYNLLDTPERVLFDRLSAFAGGWLQDAAEDICAGTLVAKDNIPHLLARLAEKSLIRPDQRSNAPRYIQLETIREYAREHLIEGGMEADIGGRHALWFLRFADFSDATVTGANIGESYDRADREHDNLRAALAWFGRHEDAGNALKLASRLTHFWVIRGYASEARAALDVALARPGSDAETRARGLERAGSVAYVQADLGAAIASNEKALALYRELANAEGIARSLYGMAIALFVRDGDAASRQAFEESICACLQCGLNYLAGNQLCNLAMNAFHAGDLQFARGAIQRMARINAGLNDVRLEIRAHVFSALSAINEGAPQQALAELQHVLELNQSAPDVNNEGVIRMHMGNAHLIAGRLDAAQEQHHAAIRLMKKAMLTLELMNALEAYAGTLAAGKMGAHAVLICAGTAAMRQRLGNQPGAAAQAARKFALEPAEEQCDEATLTQARDLGARIGLDAIATAALSFDVTYPMESEFDRLLVRLDRQAESSRHAPAVPLTGMDALLAPSGQLSQNARRELVGELAARGKIFSYQRNELLITEGEVSDRLMVLLEGRVRVIATHPPDKQIVLDEHGPGDYLGELTIDGSPRTASVIALESCRASVVPGAEVVDFIRVHPGFALDMIFKLAHRTRIATENFKGLAFLNVYSRVARLLNSLAEADGESRRIKIAPTQADIAQRVGATREMVNIIMRDLTTGGYIRKDGRELAILKKLPERW